MESSDGKQARLLNDSLLALVEQGLVEPLDAWAQSVEKTDFESRAAAAGHSLDVGGERPETASGEA